MRHGRRADVALGFGLILIIALWRMVGMARRTPSPSERRPAARLIKARTTISALYLGNQHLMA
jgi:hypothetical protein